MHPAQKFSSVAQFTALELLWPNFLCHPGPKQQHFKIFRIETNFSREQGKLMAIISKHSISLPSHCFTKTCCFEITWIKVNQPDKNSQYFVTHLTWNFFPKTAILWHTCDTVSIYTWPTLVMIMRMWLIFGRDVNSETFILHFSFIFQTNAFHKMNGSSDCYFLEY